MLQLTLFTWNGTADEAKAWVKKYKEACKKNGVTFKGYYAPLQEPYHYTIITDNESEDFSKLSSPFRDVGWKPPQMDIMISKYYAAQAL